MTVEELSTRLDKQARAIVQLRQSRDALTTRVEALERLLEGLDLPRAVLTASVKDTTYGTFIPSPLCAMCGNEKGTGRTALTCKPCAIERTTIIKDGLDRTSITRSTCFCCGAEFKPQTRFLCASCGKGHKMWVAAQ